MTKGTGVLLPHPRRQADGKPKKIISNCGGGKWENILEGELSDFWKKVHGGKEIEEEQGGGGTEVDKAKKKSM